MNINTILSNYDQSNLTIGVLGSHSALDICRGAKDAGFRTLVIAEKGRDKTYSRYYKSHEKTGCVDDCFVLDRFAQILNHKIQTELVNRSVIFVPHRSFEVYLDDYAAIEKDFQVPLFGNRRLLKIEERVKGYNQYNLLEDAGIRYPKQFKDPKKIDRLCMVKISESTRKFERAFFLVSNYEEFKHVSQQKIKKGIFTQKQLNDATVEEYIIGVQVNFNYFYSPLTQKLELLGTDTRRQTNFEGIGKIPASFQDQVLKHVSISYEEAGHIAVTVLESLLEKVFELGEKFVRVTQKKFAPGIIGPFSLQSIIISGPPKKDIIVIDVSPRMPGSPGIVATPYSNYLYGEPVSVGKRVAMEILIANKTKSLEKILT